jgi:hypothetical protein
MPEIDIENSEPFVKDILKQIGKLKVSDITSMNTDYAVIDNKPYRMVKIVFKE